MSKHPIIQAFRTNLRPALQRGLLLCLIVACAGFASAQTFGTSRDRKDDKGGQVTIEVDLGTGKKDGMPQRIVPPNTGPFGIERKPADFDKRAIISSKENIRTENDVAYAAGHTKIEYNEITLEADKMIVDLISGDVQAEGHVIYTGPNDYVKANAGRFNLVKGEGVAYGVDGQTGDLYFKSVWDEKKKGPSFRQITDRESVFKGTQFTSCEFPVPMYYIASSEVILLRNRRIYFRNPVVYIRGVPVLWLPWFSHNLAEGSPWSQVLGFNSDLGYFFRLGYRYVHKVEVPDWDNPAVTSERSQGQMDANVDILEDRGVGVGAEYHYQFDYGRHRGFIRLYGIRDRSREVPEVNHPDRNPAPDTPGDENLQDDKDLSRDESDRWIYRHEHNSKLTENLYLQWNADWVSDPDIYVDIIDKFNFDGNEKARGRLFERRLRGAASYQTKDWLARVELDRKQRLGVDRYTDFTIPGDDDLQFDPDPDFADNQDFEADGISSERYADVSENGHFRYATRLLRLFSSPLYYRFQANAFDSLDAGFNRLSDEDDARVHGVDFYGQLTHRLRLGSRTTWTNQIGAGAAFYDREDKSMVSDDLFNQGDIRPSGVITSKSEEKFFTEPDPLSLDPDARRSKTQAQLESQKHTRRVDGLRLKDKDTLVLGDGDTERSQDDVDKSYFFADYTSRLNHRFSDFLEGFLRYQIRQGTGFNQGEFYESVGRKDGVNDIYNFYTDRHFIEAGLLFYLRYPNLYAALVGGYNLEDQSKTYPNERKRYAGFSIGYKNPTNEFSANAATGVQNRQLYDSQDPRTFDQGSLNTSAGVSYLPRHHRYWARLNVQGDTKLEKDPNASDDNRKTSRFDEDETDIDVSPTIGRQFGPKYRAQIGGKYKTTLAAWDSFGITLARDLHDAEFGIFLGIENNDINARQNDDNNNDSQRSTEYDYTIRISLNFKIANDQPGLGNRTSTTLADVRNDPMYVK